MMIFVDDLFPDRIQYMNQYLDLIAEPKKADLAICFGGQRTKPATVAANLYKTESTKLIVVTGGINRFGVHEAEEMSTILMNSGVSEESIIVEPKAKNTHQNVVLSVPLVQKHVDLSSIKSIVAVTKWYHSRRALMTIKRWWPHQVMLYSLNYEDPAFPRDGWHSIPDAKERVMREYKKTFKYLEDGNISSIERVGDHFE